MPHLLLLARVHLVTKRMRSKQERQVTSGVHDEHAWCKTRLKPEKSKTQTFVTTDALGFLNHVNYLFRVEFSQLQAPFAGAIGNSPPFSSISRRLIPLSAQILSVLHCASGITSKKSRSAKRCRLLALYIPCLQLEVGNYSQSSRP